MMVTVDAIFFGKHPTQFLSFRDFYFWVETWTKPWLDLGGQWPPLIFFFLNIIKYMDTNFSNFVLENYTFVPLKISLILLRALL